MHEKLVLLIGYVLLVMSVFAQENLQESKFAKALAKAKMEGKFVFVKCYASWSRVGTLKGPYDREDVENDLKNKYVYIALDAAKDEGKFFSEKFDIRKYPTYIVLSPEGKVLARLIGAWVINLGFVKMVEQQVNESVVFYLKRCYDAGNRDMDLVVQYVFALKKAGDIRRAQEVAMDLLNLLTDEERTSMVCWPIYEDAELSPVGSGNMFYLLRRVPQFRQSVGDEKVDARVFALFETQLENILCGQNSGATMADVESIENLLQIYQLQDVGFLLDYIDLSKAMLTGNTVAVLSVGRKMFVTMDDAKLSRLYFYPLMALKGKWTEEQKKELENLTTELITLVQSEELKCSLRNFVKEIWFNL